MNKPAKSFVELNRDGPRPSRIRREPPPPPEKPKELKAYPTERETWAVSIGVLLFGIAITIIIIAFSDYTS